MTTENIQDLELLIRSRIPLIVVETDEETQMRELLAQIGERLGRSVMDWSVTSGLQHSVKLGLIPREGENPFADYPETAEKGKNAEVFCAEPTELLRYLASYNRPALFILLDFHPYLSEPALVRQLKEIALAYESQQATLVFISHKVEMPRELKLFTASFSPQLPTPEQIEAIIREEAKKWSIQTKSQVKTTRKVLEQMTRNLMGLTASDVRRLVRGAICDDGAITESDLPGVMSAKYRLLDRDGVLSYEYDTAKYADLGGFARMKRWIEQRKEPFMRVPPATDIPKGVLLLGVQGCGKSLAAKMVAGVWGVPLLRLDMGNLYNKYVGETEKNLRDALLTAELMAPCVVWMDELEKGISVSQGDDGISRRLLGTLLTWLAEKRKAVFLVATANDISQLPPELIRKGRMDEIFFVDLPCAEVRQAIFTIHLRRRKVNIDELDLQQLAQASAGFNGAEIEQVVVAGIYLAREESSVVKQQHLLTEIEQTRPLSVVMSEAVTALRQWSAGRTVPAH